MSFKLVFGCVPFIVWALTCLAFVRPSRLGKAAKGVWCVVLLVCFGKFLWFKLLGGDAFVPDLPEKLIWFMNWFYSGAFVLFALAAVSLRLQFKFKMLLLPALSWLLAGWNNGFTKGVYDLPGGGRLYVSPGSGQWAGFPMRLFNPSVITVITLVSGQSQNSCKSGR